MSVKKLRRRLSDPLIGAAAHVAVSTVGCLSHGGLDRVARLMAPLVYACASGARRLILANLQVAFPDWSPQQRRDVAREAMRNMILTVLEFAWFTNHPDRLVEYCDFQHDESSEVIAAGCSGQGTMMVTPHLGNWELEGQALAAHGVELYAVAHETRNPHVARLISRARHYHGMRIILERGAAREMLKVLRSGKPVAVLMDQNTRPHRGGTFAEFFGLPVAVTRAPAAFALKARVPAMVGAFVRRDGRFAICREKLPKPVPEYESEEELTRDLLAANERLVRRFPEQYVWLYQRWRYIPPDATPQMRERFPFYARECTLGL